MSDEGIVYSRRTFRKHNPLGNEMKELAQNEVKGYRTVTLCINQKRKTKKVHRLVYETFVGSLEGKHVHHKDRDRANNKLENLEGLSEDEHVKAHDREQEYIQYLIRRGYTVSKRVER